MMPHPVSKSIEQYVERTARPLLSLPDSAPHALRVACWPLYAAFWLLGVLFESIAEGFSRGAEFITRSKRTG
jgi:hypothetical protein